MLLQGRSDPAVRHVSELVAIPHNPFRAFPPTGYMNLRTAVPYREMQYLPSEFTPTDYTNLRTAVPYREMQYLPLAFPPTDQVNLRDLMLHREMQHLPWSNNNILPSFQSQIINHHLLHNFPTASAIETQLVMQQLIQESTHTSNLTRLYHDHLSSSQVHVAIQQENIANQSPITAYLLSRSIGRESLLGNQRVAIPDPTPPQHPPPPTTIELPPQTLVQPQDYFTLSDFQVFLRENIEVFQATAEEASIHVRGRNTAIYLHQAGIRCIHCKHLPLAHRPKGSMYFPSNTARIYQAAQNMASSHMTTGLCGGMPAGVQARFQTLMIRRSVSGKGGRDYWAQSAEAHLGLVNTPLGMRRTAAAANALL
jgi:hypothetical protein